MKMTTCSGSCLAAHAKRKLLAALLALSCFSISPAGAAAATITVANTNDAGAGSLRQAIADSSDGDTIDFSVTGAIKLTSAELFVNKSVTISGPGARSLAVDGNANGRVFHIAPGKTVAISGLTIRNASANAGPDLNDGGGIYNDHATLTVTNCTVSGNFAVLGGGIMNDGSSGSASLTISNSTLSGNSASFLGGGIYNDGAFSSTTTVTVDNCTLSGNSAPEGGGIDNGGFSGNPTLTVRNSTLSGNSAPSGGGIYNSATSSGNATLNIGNTILNAGASGANIFNDKGTVTSNGYNLSSDNGGGFLAAATDQISTDPKLAPLADNGGPTSTHALFAGSPAIDKGKDLSGTGKDQRGRTRPRDEASITNAAGGDGSDIGAFEGTARVVINNNDGGAGSLRQVLADSSDNDTVAFDAAVNGQTITLTTGELLVSASVAINGPGAKQLAVDGNNASRVFHIASGKTASISGLTIRDGRGQYGGGIFNDHATLTLTNCAVTLNQADFSGGGIDSEGFNGSVTLTVRNCTLSGNSAKFQGGAIYNDTDNGTATLTIENSTLSGNFVTTGSGGAITNDPTSGGGPGTGRVTITNSTFSGNSASQGDSIYNFGVDGSAPVTIGNSILDATGSGDNVHNNGGTVTSQGYNLSSDGGVINFNGGTGSLSATGDQINTDPKLAPLGDNGGPTLTHSFRGRSPAIDKGKDLSGAGTDQRGRSRPFDVPLQGDAAGGDGSDIGAFELVTHVVTNLNDTGAGSLRQVIGDALAGDGVYFDASLNGTIPFGSSITLDKSVTILGPGAKVISLNGNGNCRGFYSPAGGFTINFTGLTFENFITDATSGSGAAIHNLGSAMSFNRCAFNNNSLAAYGGAVFAWAHDDKPAAVLDFDSCTFSANSAFYGGAIATLAFNNGSVNVSVVNSTFSGNAVSAFDFGGGAIANIGSSVAAVNHCTFSGNNSGNGRGGAIYTDDNGDGGNSVAIGNTILQAGSGGTLYQKSGTITSLGYNLSSDDGGGFLTGTGDQISTDPKLDPDGLQDNGGRVLTIALAPGSPAIDTGDPSFDPTAFSPWLSTDERGSGFPRVIGGTIDKGAYESGIADHLRFSIQPTDTLVGHAITPAVKVQVVDAGGVLIGSSTADITIELGTNPGGGTLSGTTTVAAVNGTATFSDLSIDQVGDGYTLLAGSPNLQAASSDSFNVLPLPQVEFSAANYQVQENQTSVTLTLNRSGDLSADAVVHVETSDGTAVAGSDYIARSFNKTIPAGSASATFKITIVNDHTAEPTETFTVALTGSASADLGAQQSATVTIIDKDGPNPAIEFESATYQFKENSGAAVLVLKRVGKQSTKATVNFATSDGTAHSGSDYTAKSGIVTFDAGGPDTKTISIPIVNDRTPEPDKTFQVTLSAPGGATLGTPKTATVTIVDLD